MDIKAGNNKFYIGEENDPLAIIEYSIRKNDLLITHTFVNNTLRGQGIAASLTEEVLKYAKENDYNVVPICSFAVKYMERKGE